MESKLHVGFVGLGVMGASMAGQLLKSCPLTVYTRTAKRAKPLLEAGADWAESPAAVASCSDVVVTIVGYPEDVEAVYLGPQGLMSQARAGQVFVDMTTSSPSLAVRIAEAGREKGVICLDAPVTGGDKGAREATLSIMVGGDAEGLAKVRPLLELMGKHVVHHGPAGAGQKAKLVNQVAVAGGMLAVTEALSFARASGLDTDKVLESISGGAAGSWALENLAPRMLQEDWAPGFYVKHFVKDLRLASVAAAENGQALPALALATHLYTTLASVGGENDGTQALLRLYEEGRLG